MITNKLKAQTGKFKNIQSKKTLFLAILGAFGIFLAWGQLRVYAEGMAFICEDNECTLTSDTGSFFGGNTVYPGDSINRSLSITNKNDETCKLYVSAVNVEPSPEVNEHFTDMLNTGIKLNTGSTVYGELLDTRSGTKATSYKTLKDVFNEKTLFIGEIKDSETREYNWIVTFDISSTDDIQGEFVAFDLNVNMTCGSPGDFKEVSDEEFEYIDVEVYVDEQGNEVNPEDVIQENTGFIQSVATVLGLTNNNSNSDVYIRKPPSDSFIDQMLSKFYSTQESTSNKATGDVQGESSEDTTLCSGDNKWLWVFVLQVVLHFVMAALIKKNEHNSHKIEHGVQILNFIIFVIIFLTTYCP